MYHLFIVNFFRTFSHFFLHHKFFYKIRWQKLLESYWKLRHEIHTLYVSLNSFALSLVFAPLPTLFKSFWQCLFFSFLYNLVSRATCIATNRPWHLLFLRLTQVLHSTWIYLSSYFEIFFFFLWNCSSSARTKNRLCLRDLIYQEKKISQLLQIPDLWWPQVA